jgi:hypothetical protein
MPPAKGLVIEFIAPDFIEGIVRKAYARIPHSSKKVRAAYSAK